MRTAGDDELARGHAARGGLHRRAESLFLEHRPDDPLEEGRAHLPGPRVVPERRLSRRSISRSCEHRLGQGTRIVPGLRRLSEPQTLCVRVAFGGIGRQSGWCRSNDHTTGFGESASTSEPVIQAASRWSSRCINAVVTYRVADARRAEEAAEDVSRALNREAQLALRSVIGTRELDPLLAEKDAVASELEEAVRDKAGGRVARGLFCGPDTVRRSRPS